MRRVGRLARCFQAGKSRWKQSKFTGRLHERTARDNRDRSSTVHERWMKVTKLSRTGHHVPIDSKFERDARTLHRRSIGDGKRRKKFDLRQSSSSNFGNTHVPIKLREGEYVGYNVALNAMSAHEWHDAKIDRPHAWIMVQHPETRSQRAAFKFIR